MTKTGRKFVAALPLERNLEWVVASYPSDFGETAPPLPNARLRFDWINTRDNAVLASKTCAFDENANLELTKAEKRKANWGRFRRYREHLKQPL